MLTCRVNVIDEVNVRLEGLDPDTLSNVIDAMTFHVPNYMFMPAYKIGRWNGKIKLCKPTGRTYLHLFDQIRPLVENAGYGIEVVDGRKPFTFVPEEIDEDIFSGITIGEFKGVLDDHQVEAVNSLIVNGGGVIELATGGGKTIITAALARSYKDAGKILIIVPRIDLAIKTQYVIRECKMDCGIYFEEIKDVRDITVTTWQSLALSPELFEGVKCVIVDEAHEAKASVLFDNLTGPGKHVPIRIGMTGTLPDVDLYRYQIMAALGPVVFTMEAYELQQKGFLAGCEVQMFKFLDSKSPDYQRAKDSHQLYTDELNWKATDPIRMQYLAALIREVAVEGNTLVLVQFKNMGFTLESLLPEAEFLSGQNSGKMRHKTYSEINKAENAILIATYGIASTGIDIPRLFNMVIVEPGKDAIRVVQSIGRGLRKASDKEHVRIVDVCSDAHFSKRHIPARQKIYKRRKYPFTMFEVDYYADSVQ